MNFFENILHHLQWSSLMNIYIGIELVKSLNCLGRLLPSVQHHAPTSILKILFFKANISPLLDELPLKIIPYFIMEWKYGQ
jgi:hypothetical protein